jgi:hypothetical protein
MIEKKTSSSDREDSSDPDESGSGEESGDDCISGTWTHTVERDANDVILLIDPVQHDSLQLAGDEMPRLVEQVRQEANMCLSEWDHDKSLVFWMRPVLVYGLQHVNAVRTRTNQSQISVRDFVSFLHFEAALFFYGVSPTMAFNNPSTFVLAASVSLPRKLYFEILGCLEQPRYVQAAYELDKGLMELERAVGEQYSKAWVKGKSVVAFDDNKLGFSGKMARLHGLVVRKIGDSFGPVQHSVCSVLTGVFLGAHVEMRGESVEDILGIVFRRLTRSELVSHIDLMGTILTKDRGYNTKVTSMFCLNHGADELGTRKREGNFAFTWGKKNAKDGQINVEMSGHPVARFAMLRPLPAVENRPTLRLHGLAWRANGRVVLLQTSAEDLGSFKWTYATRRKKEVPVVFRSKDDVGELGAAADTLVHEFKDGVVEVTLTQGTPDWFLARRFLLTSSIAGTLIKRWFREGLQVFVDSEQDQRASRTSAVALLSSVLGLQLQLGAPGAPGAPGTDGTEERRNRYKAAFMSRQFTLIALKQLCKQHINDSNPWHGNKEVLAAALANADVDPNTIGVGGKSMRQTILDSWYMRPLEKRALRIGSENESAIVTWLDGHLQRFARLRVIRVLAFGLVRHREEARKHVATSIDGLLILQRLGPEGEPEGAPFRMLAEFKTRSSADTVAAAKAVDASQGGKRFYSINAESAWDRFHRLVPDSSYRTQLAHHCSTTDEADVLYVEATQVAIIYAVAIKFPAAVRTAMWDVLHFPLIKLHIKTITDALENSMPFNRDTDVLGSLGLEPGYAVDDVTFRQSYLLWTKIMEKAATGTPFPPAAKIIPRLVDAWNNLKGGVDVFTRLTSHMEGAHPRLNMFGRLFLLHFQTALMNDHLVGRIADLLSELKTQRTSITNKFSSYKQLKDRLNTMRTLKDYLHALIPRFKDALEPIKGWEEPILTVAAAATAIDPGADGKPTRGYSIKGLRSIWNLGEMSSTRRHKRALEHTPTPLGGQVRCIICCCKCESETDNTHYRLGYRTSFGCHSCAVAAEKKQHSITPGVEGSPAKQVQPLPLCVRRNGVTRDCWAIHHSLAEYPHLECTAHETPKKLGPKQPQAPETLL